MITIPHGWVEVSDIFETEALLTDGGRIVPLKEDGDLCRFEGSTMEKLGIKKVRRARMVEKIVPITKDLDLRTVKAVLNEGTRYKVTTSYKDEVGLRSSDGERSFYGFSRTTLMFFGMQAVIEVPE